MNPRVRPRLLLKRHIVNRSHENERIRVLFPPAFSRRLGTGTQSQDNQDNDRHYLADFLHAASEDISKAKIPHLNTTVKEKADSRCESKCRSPCPP
jgi:hypothetical protein